MFTVPLGIACAIVACCSPARSLNVYSQIGLVLLVGIMAKNGILIVEFANQLRDRGRTVREAIEQASIIRLRPVMMTMVSTVLGGVPLILSQARAPKPALRSVGSLSAVWGLATFATLFLTPVAYLMLARFAKPQTHEAERLARELNQAQA